MVQNHIADRSKKVVGGDGEIANGGDMQDVKLTEADFNKQSIRDSYLGTSFSPDKRAEDEIAGHIRWFNGTVDDLSGLCSNDEQHAYLTEQLPRFRAKYLEHASACTAAHSSCISTMIAGGSNFPVRRAEKANASHIRHINAMLDWQPRAIAAIKKGIEERKTPDQVEADYMDDVRKMVRHAYLREDFGRRNFYGRFQTWARLASPKMVQTALDYLKEYQDKYHEGKGFTARHKIWQVVGACADEPTEDQSVEINGISVVRNGRLDRVQIIFPGKPEPDVITQLKAHGWQWSPKNVAWQRQNTDNAYRSAVEIARM